MRYTLRTSSQSASKVTSFQAKSSHCLSSSSVLGAGSLYVVSFTIIQMVSSGLKSHEFGIKLENPSDTMLAWSVHCLFLFKAFQLFLVTYPHTVMLDVQLKFFYLSVLWNYYAYIYSYFDNISHTVCKKRPSSPWFVFLGLYFWPFVRSSFRLLQQFGNLFLTEWPEDHKIDAWALAQTV